MTESLFRPEVVATRSIRLHGAVVLVQPISSRIFTAAILFIVAIAGTWLVLGSYSRIERVPGILVTSDASTKIQVPVSGRVVRMDVAEGTMVQAGDTLAVIDLDRHTADGRDSTGDAIAALDRRIQLGTGQLRLLEQETAKERTRLRRRVEAADGERVTLARQIGLQRQLVASNQSLVERLTAVVDRGYVSRVEYERRRQALLGSEQVLAQLEQQLIAREGDKAEAEAQLSALSVRAAREASSVEASIQALEQERSRLGGEQSYRVTAPISGRVTALQTARGRMVVGAAPLMTIVPEEAHLRAEIYAPSRAVGLVRPGQETRLLLDSFPYRRFGSFGGHILSISHVIIDPRESTVPFQMQEPFYTITVALDSQTVDALGEHLPLQPGMTLQANVILERQSFLGWLLAPLNSVLRRTS